MSVRFKILVVCKYGQQTINVLTGTMKNHPRRMTTKLFHNCSNCGTNIIESSNLQTGVFNTKCSRNLEVIPNFLIYTLSTKEVILEVQRQFTVENVEVSNRANFHYLYVQNTVHSSHNE